jgi:hypothetical protein
MERLSERLVLLAQDTPLQIVSVISKLGSLRVAYRGGSEALDAEIAAAKSLAHVTCEGLRRPRHTADVRQVGRGQVPSVCRVTRWRWGNAYGGGDGYRGVGRERLPAARRGEEKVPERGEGVSGGGYGDEGTVTDSPPLSAIRLGSVVTVASGGRVKASAMFLKIARCEAVENSVVPEVKKKLCQI